MACAPSATCPGRSTALVSFLAAKLKPVLVEGPAGVGKTELAKALSRYLERRLVRLQCYEGLDEAKALYEWNYRKQLLRIQSRAQATTKAPRLGRRPGRHLLGDFLLERPLMARDRLRGPGRAADRRDRQDRPGVRGHAARAARFQISIPELGRIDARTQPVVLLTSNNSRELTEALKRRCLYLWWTVDRAWRWSWRSCACTRPASQRRWPESWWR